MPAMKPQTGMILRLVGPLIEIACAAVLVRTWGQGVTVGGTPIEPILMLGFVVGLSMVVAGLTMVRKPSSLRRPPGKDRLL